MVAPSIAVISALTALFASVSGPLVTLHVARLQLNASVRSANRQRWIDEFRDLVAHFCAELAVAETGRERSVRDGRIVAAAEREFLGSFGKLIYTARKIRLMVNPIDPDHQSLLAAVDGVLSLFRTAPEGHDIHDQGLRIVETIVTQTLAIVRREWLLVQRGV